MVWKRRGVLTPLRGIEFVQKRFALIAFTFWQFSKGNKLCFLFFLPFSIKIRVCALRKVFCLTQDEYLYYEYAGGHYSYMVTCFAPCSTFCVCLCLSLFVHIHTWLPGWLSGTLLGCQQATIKRY